MELIDLVHLYQKATSLEQRQKFGHDIAVAIRPALWNFLLHQDGPEQADDLCQETLKDIFKNLHMFHEETNGQFWSWCYHVARNKLIDHWRKQKANPTMTLDPEAFWRAVEASAQDNPLSNEDQLNAEYILELLAEAKPACCAYLWLRYIIGLDLSEMARMYNLSIDAIRMRINRCLDLAKVLIEKHP